MAYKNIEDSRAAIRRHYYANRQYYIDKAKRRKKDIKDLIMIAKEYIPCADCGRNYPYYVMDFDHIGGKAETINFLAENSSLEKLENEIARCEVVCANCHRQRTHNRRTAKSSII